MDVIDVSKQKTEEGKQELYLYSLRKRAEDNVEHNRNPLTRLQNLRSFFYMGGEIIREHPGEQYAVISMDIAQFKAAVSYTHLTLPTIRLV